MLTFDSHQLLSWLSQFFWPLARVLALIATAPILSENTVNSKVKLGLAIMITWLLVPVLPATHVTLFSYTGFWVLIQQIIIGTLLGFTMQFAFAAVRTAGEIIGLQIGLSFCTLFDPSSNSNTLVLGRFLDMLALLLFLSFNGHLWLISLLADSFHILPVGSEALNANIFLVLVQAGGLIFLQGLMLALPLITLLLTLNLSLGLLNRFSPQLSVFAIGFPITLSIGIWSISIIIPFLTPFCEHLFNILFDLLFSVLSGLQG